MSKFTTANYHELLGVSPVSQVSDEVIWENLISPITKALLGPILKSRAPQVLDTVDGLFPGDEAKNLNDHKLYGGEDGFVRFPYVHSVYETENGLFIVKRDLVKFEVFCWLGNVKRGRGELIYKAGLRDRRFDGTLRANDSALLDYKYSDPILHRPLSDELSSVEFSIYAYMPGSRIVDATGDDEHERFVTQPYAFLAEPDKFLTHFQVAWKSKRAPGQNAVPIPDVSSVTLRGFKKIAVACGYDLLEMAPSHYHVARWGLQGGYQFAYAEQKKAVDALKRAIEKQSRTGSKLSRTQQSWICVIQSLAPSKLIPSELNLGGPKWPQDNISDQCLWLYKPLSKRAQGFVPPCFNKPLTEAC